MLLQEKISSLFYTFDEVNYALLLELVAGNNWLEDCASELLLIAHFSKEASNKARALELLLELKQQGHADSVHLAEQYLIEVCPTGDLDIPSLYFLAMYCGDSITYNELLYNTKEWNPNKLFSLKMFVITIALHQKS